jgi:hypothetical protein
MDANLLKDMVDIALENKSSKETIFSTIELEQKTIRLGCIRILEWLRVQSVALRKRSSILKKSSTIDSSCFRLVEAADFLREIVQIKDNYLAFSENISIDQAQTMMIYAKENYCPPLFFDKSINK